MKVLLTGATGFVGSYVTPALLGAGHEVFALVRPGSEKKLAPEVKNNAAFHVVPGDALDKDSLRRIEPGCEAVVHLVGIIQENKKRGVTFERMHVEAVENITKLAIRHGMIRFIHMSALGTHENAQSRYHRTKLRGEHVVKSSQLQYVIMRPSLIFGPGDGFVNLQKKFIFPFSPVIVPGNGKTRFQPVAVENVAEGFAKALTLDRAANQIYEIGGPDKFTFDEIIDMIAQAKKVSGYYKLHVPIGLMMPFVGIAERVPNFPLSQEQLIMLKEDNTCEARRFYEEFDIKPLSFSVESLRRYV